MVILAAGGKTVRLGGEGLVLCGACLLEGHGLEVAGGDGLRVVPADFERADAHVTDAASRGACTAGGRGSEVEKDKERGASGGLGCHWLGPSEWLREGLTLAQRSVAA